MKKDEIENGIKIFIENLKTSRTKLKFKNDVAYIRKMDGKFLDSSNQDRYILGSIIFTEDPEKVKILDSVIQKITEKRNIKFENLGEIDI